MYDVLFQVIKLLLIIQVTKPWLTVEILTQTHVRLKDFNPFRILHLKAMIVFTRKQFVVK